MRALLALVIVFELMVIVASAFTIATHQTPFVPPDEMVVVTFDALKAGDWDSFQKSFNWQYIAQSAVPAEEWSAIASDPAAVQARAGEARDEYHDSFFSPMAATLASATLTVNQVPTRESFAAGDRAVEVGYNAVNNETGEGHVGAQRFTIDYVTVGQQKQWLFMDAPPPF